MTNLITRPKFIEEDSSVTTLIGIFYHNGIAFAVEREDFAMMDGEEECDNPDIFFVCYDADASDKIVTLSGDADFIAAAKVFIEEKCGALEYLSSGESGAQSDDMVALVSKFAVAA